MRLPRDCRSCRRPFDAYTGGRPRVLCASCRPLGAFEAESEVLPDPGGFFARLRAEIASES